MQFTVTKNGPMSKSTKFPLEVVRHTIFKDSNVSSNEVFDCQIPLMRTNDNREWMM